MRQSALLELSSGLLLGALGVRIASGAVPAEAPRPAASSGAPERSVTIGQTLRDTEPPPTLGEAFDRDSSLNPAANAVASYTLRARLDEKEHGISGEGTVEWANASSRPAEELYVHLYLNAFKNNRSVFLRSPFSGNRSGRGAEHWGTIDVQKLTIREMGGTNVWPENPRSEDDPDDQTDIRVPLPRAVLPGEKITLDVVWTSRLPGIVERTGYVKDFHMVAQWFPKIARREPDGTWAHFPFNAESEFYADYGNYDVTIDVAQGMVVGATGSLVDEHDAAGRHVSHYRASSVHDFAFTAWQSFRAREEMMGDVRVRVLYPPGNDRNAERTLAAVRHGLSRYGALFGRYPYPTLTVVHPPEFAPQASGMEYPTLITTGFPWCTGYLSTFVERVTLHELGHQWFYGLIGTDEHSFPFLDEGLTTFAESSAMRALYGEGNGLAAAGLRIDGNAYFRALAAEAGHDDIVARPAASFSTFREIGALVYARTGTILETLGRVYGRPALDRALGRYARRYRFEHPSPKHLVAAVREVMGDDAAATLHAALFDGGWVDFIAKDLRTTPVSPKAGLFDQGTRRETLEAPREATGRPWASRVVVYRHGTLRLPVDVELHFEDGTSTRKHWDGYDRWRSFEVEGPSRLVSAVVDPDLKVLLDDDLANNAVTRRPATPLRTVERALYFTELLLGAIGP